MGLATFLYEGNSVEGLKKRIYVPIQTKIDFFESGHVFWHNVNWDFAVASSVSIYTATREKSICLHNHFPYIKPSTGESKASETSTPVSTEGSSAENITGAGGQQVNLEAASDALNYTARE